MIGMKVGLEQTDEQVRKLQQDPTVWIPDSRADSLSNMSTLEDLASG